MAFDNGSKPRDLNQLWPLLQPIIRRYDFHQLMRQLEYQFGNKIIFDQSLHLQASASLSFASSDVTELSCNDNKSWQIILTFLGLYGVSSPLPHYFLTTALSSTQAAQILTAFLNIFNRRIYQLSYLAWKKYRPLVQLEQGNYNYQNYLQALTGHRLDLNQPLEFASAGLLARRIISSTTLQQILKIYLNPIEVHVKTFILRRLTINNPARLGVAHQHSLKLNDNSLLGNYALDKTSKIIIQLAPLNFNEAIKYLPNQTTGIHLVKFIRRLLNIVINFDLQLQIHFDQIFTLGQSNYFLGWNIILGQAKPGIYQLTLPESSFMIYNALLQQQSLLVT